MWLPEGLENTPYSISCLKKGIKKHFLNSSMRKPFSIFKWIYLIERRSFDQKYKFSNKNDMAWAWNRVGVQWVKSLGGHFACLCWGFNFYELKRIFFVLIFQKENRNNFTLLIIFLVKSLQKEQNRTNLLLLPPTIKPK